MFFLEVIALATYKNVLKLGNISNLIREVRTENTMCYVTHKVNYPSHLHDDVEIFFLLKGSGNVYCDGQKYKLEEGMIFCAFPNQLHSFCDFEESAAGYVMIFKPESLFLYNNVFIETYPLNNLYVPNSNESRKLKSLMEIFIAEVNDMEDNIDTNIQSAYLTLIFIKIFKDFKLQTRRSDILSKIINYCITNYDKPISIASLSEMFNISQNHLSRLFNQRMHMHFCDYMNTLRISKAQILLENSAYNITEISNMVGFSTLRSFNRAFLKLLGTTPTKFRKERENHS